MNPEMLAAAMAQVWLMEPVAFRSMIGKLRSWLANGTPQATNVFYQARAEGYGKGKKRKDVAVLSLSGPIEQRASLWVDWFGGTSTEQFGMAFDAAMDDPDVKSVLIDVSSPGGSYSGTPELATKIYKRRGEKPIIAVADSLAASAAYWIPSAADQLYVTPSGYAGSVGVFAVHEDWSAALANEGVKVSLMRVPEFKAEGNPYEPATEEFVASEMNDLNRIYGEFTDAVAKHRGTTQGVVKETYGKGRVLSARDAVSVGMADGVATFEQVLSRMQSGTLKAKQRIEEGDETPQLNASAMKIAAARQKLRTRLLTNP